MTSLAAATERARWLEQLDGLALHLRRGMGERPGDRRFPGRPQASGIELESHSAYSPGDDLRHLDWNAVGRLDALLVRRFTAEREVVVHLLVDASASMGVPAADRKLAVAAELALALAYVALSTNDAVRVALFDGEGVPRVSPILRQRASVLRAAELFDAARPGRSLMLGAALEAYALRHPAPGLAIVISDLMMEPAEVERGLVALRRRRWEVLVLHVIGRGELEPARHFSAGVLTDAESGETHPMALTPAAIARYQALLDDHLAALRAATDRTEAVYARLVTDADLRDFVAVELPRLGVIRRR